MKTIASAPIVGRTASSTEEPESLSAGVVHRLEVEILKGQRKPGDRLDERDGRTAILSNSFAFGGNNVVLAFGHGYGR